MRTDHQTGLHEKVQEALQAITRGRPAFHPQVGIVLGSGLGAFADAVGKRTVIPYSDIPHMPVSSVVGHAGELVLGDVGGIHTAMMSGRVHGYEGRDPEDCTFGIRLMQALGVKTVVLTNAAGGINEEFFPGDLMVITDHLNLTCQSPLTGPNDSRLGTRFPDMSTAYDPELRQRLQGAAHQLGISLHEGVYAMLTGPSYETPAEIRMLRALGANAVGMSTVLECIAAIHAGMKVVGISCITNKAAGLSSGPLSHTEVRETADRVSERFIRLLAAAVPLLATA